MRLWHAGNEGGEDRSADVEDTFQANGADSTLYIRGGGIARGDYLIAGEGEREAFGVVTDVRAHGEAEAVRARFERL